MSIVKRIIPIFLLALLFSACKKEATTWENRVRAPLLKSRLNSEDLLPAGELRPDAENKLSLVRKDTLFRLPLDSLLQLPDTSLTKAFVAPSGGLTVDPGQTLISNQETRKLQLPKAELSEMVLHRGEIRYRIKNSLDEPALLEYRIPAATKDGKALRIQRSVPAGSRNDPSIVTGVKELEGYHFDLSGPNGGKVNRFRTETEAWTDPDGESFQLQNNDSLSIRNRFRGLRPRYAKGYFGQRTIAPPPRTTSFGMFQAVRSGDLDIDSIGIELTIDNGIGMDARLELENLTAKGTGGSVELDHSMIGSPLNIARAQKDGWSMDHTFHEETLTSQNSNIDEFLEVLPEQLEYEWRTETDPLGDVSNGNDVMMRGHDLHARMRMEMPLSLIANELTLVDTLDWNVKERKSGKLEEGTLYLHVDNGFPLAGELSFHLHEESGKRIGTLFEDRTLPAASTDASWRVTESEKEELRITISPSQADKLRRCDRVSLVARFNTPAGAPHIDIYEDYGLEMRLDGDLRYQNEWE